VRKRGCPRKGGTGFVLTGEGPETNIKVFLQQTFGKWERGKKEEEKSVKESKKLC